MIYFIILINLIWLPLAAAEDSSLLQKPEVQRYITKLIHEHDFHPHEIKEIFKSAKFNSEIINLISSPYEAKPWHKYRQAFINEERINGGVCFWYAYQKELDRASKNYGVPPEIIIAILGVETKYGKFMGRHKALDALATLAFFYPPRARFFKKELTHYLLLSKSKIVDPYSTLGSYAGALGLSQFMPSSYRLYAVDFSGNGVADLFKNPIDAIGSIGHYFIKHGWRRNDLILVNTSLKKPLNITLPTRGFQPKQTLKELAKLGIKIPKKLPGKKKATLLKYADTHKDEYKLGFYNFYVITRYNNSQNYARAVVELSQEIAKRMKNVQNIPKTCPMLLGALEGHSYKP